MVGPARERRGPRVRTPPARRRCKTSGGAWCRGAAARARAAHVARTYTADHRETAATCRTRPLGASMTANERVREYWEQEACGTDRAVVGDLRPHTREWFEEVERCRYDVEPFIHSMAQFTRHHGRAVLEVGVGAGTDHLQWARAGCHCHGV